MADNVELHLLRRLDFEESLQPDFEIAHGHNAVDGSLAEFLGESEDVRGDRAQVAVLLFQAVQFPRLRSGRALGPPALELLRVDIDELFELLAMHPLDAINGRIVEDMWLGPRFGQGVEMVAGVPESAVDEAGDERHLARRLPVHGSG
jgi:hypothetical protein